MCMTQQTNSMIYSCTSRKLIRGEKKKFQRNKFCRANYSATTRFLTCASRYMQWEGNDEFGYQGPITVHKISTHGLKYLVNYSAFHKWNLREI